MKLLLTVLVLCISCVSWSSSVNDFDKIQIKIGGTTHGSNGWCSWFPVFKNVTSEYSLVLPEGWTARTMVTFCDQVQIVTENDIDFFDVVQRRYPDCLNISVDQEEKKIFVSKGANMVEARRDSVAKFYLLTEEGSVEVHRDEHPGGVSYMCAHDIENAPDKTKGHYKIMKAAKELR